MATTTTNAQKASWVNNQFILPFIFVLIILGYAGGIYLQGEQDEVDDLQTSNISINAKNIAAMGDIDEDTVKGWVNTANEVLIANDSSLQTRVTTLENKPVSTSSVLTQTEKNSIFNEINLLKSKVAIAEGDIDDLEEEDSSSSSSSSSNRNIQQDTTMDRPSNFYDRGDRITFSGLTDSRADVELYISYDGDRDEEVGDDTADSNGRWVITCISKCTEDRGDYEVYVLNIDNDDKSRTYDYEVD